MKIAIARGKAGTGKTSIVASFAALAENKKLADCDVHMDDIKSLRAEMSRTLL